MFETMFHVTPRQNYVNNNSRFITYYCKYDVKLISTDSNKFAVMRIEFDIKFD